MEDNKKNEPENSKEIFLYGTIDERTKAVANKGDALMGRLLLFVILLDVIIRSFIKLEIKETIAFFDSNWDLLLIVIFGGMFSTFYQIKHKIIFNGPKMRNLILILLLVLFSAFIAFVLGFILNK